MANYLCKEKVLLTRMANTLSLVDKFEIFSDLEIRVREYEKVTYTKYWRRDSRIVAALQRRRARNISIKEELVYGGATYCCKQGGREFKSQTTGERPNTSSFRQKCPGRFRMKASKMDSVSSWSTSTWSMTTRSLDRSTTTCPVNEN